MHAAEQANETSASPSAQTTNQTTNQTTLGEKPAPSSSRAEKSAGGRPLTAAQAHSVNARDRERSALTKSSTKNEFQISIVRDC